MYHVWYTQLQLGPTRSTNVGLHISSHLHVGTLPFSTLAKRIAVR